MSPTETSSGNGTAIVTGGARGIGRACALRLAGAGYSVAVWDVDERATRATTKEITDRGGHATATALDVADETTVDVAVVAIENKSPVSVLVNNAGILRLTPIDGLDLADWDAVIRVNLRGPLVCTRAVVPAMKRRERGAIVNVVSNVVAAARLHNGAYAAAKEGLLGLTKVLAIELAAHRIRVNEISPGSTRTELMDTYDDAVMEGILRGSLEMYRIGIPSAASPIPPITPASSPSSSATPPHTSPARPSPDSHRTDLDQGPAKVTG